MSALDAVVSPERQSDWLAAPEKHAPPFDRLEASDPIEYQERCAQIVTAPHWRKTSSFLRKIILECLLEFAKTEKIWWSLTVGANADFVRLNVGPQELVAISPWEHFDFHVLANNGLLNQLDHEWFELRDALVKESKYVVVGRQIWIESENASFLEILQSEPSAIRAIKELSLDLMRAKRNVWARSHCPMLVSRIISDHETTFDDVIVGGSVYKVAPEIRTEVERTVWLRCNSARFSQPVKNIWGNCCALSGIKTPEILEACHIKPWSICSGAEKFDVDNGICLSANLHKCFDANLITINENGRVNVSTYLSKDERERLALKVTHLRLNQRQIHYFHERNRMEIRS